MRVVKILTAFILTLGLGACSGVSSLEDVSSIENLNTAIEKAKKEFNDVKFTSFTIYTDVNRDCQMEMISVVANDKVMTYLALTNVVTESENTITSSKKRTPHSFDDIDSDFIIQKFNEGKELISSQTDEFEGFKIYKVDVDVNESNQLEYSLSLFANQKEVKPTMWGERVRPKESKFTFDIVIDKEGNVSLKK